MAVGSVYLDSIEPGLLSSGRSLAESFRNHSKVITGHLTAIRHTCTLHARRPYGHLPCEIRVGKASSMSQLDSDLTTCIMHGFGHSGQSRDKFVAVNTKLPRSGLVLPAKICVACNDQSHSPSCKSNHEIGKLWGA